VADGALVKGLAGLARRRWLIVGGLALLFLVVRGGAAIALPYRNLGNRPLLALAADRTPATADLQRAERQLIQSAALTPDDRIPYRSVGVIRTLQGDLDGAAAAFLTSTDVSLPTYTTTTWLMLAAIQRLERQDYAAAVRLSELTAALTAQAPGLALGCNSKVLDVPVGRGWRWRRDGDAQAGELAYRLAIAAAPNCPAFHYWLGSFFAEERRYDEAVVAYQEGLAIDTTTQAEGYTGLARAYLELGRLDDVATAAAAGLASGGWDWPHYLLGRVAQLRGDLPAAEAHYRQVLHPPGASLAKDWSTWFSYFHLAWIYFERGDTGAAVAYLRAASQLMPGTTAEPQAIKYLGDVHARRGMWPEAIREYQRALALAPADWQWAAVIYRALGDAYRDSGQPEAAVRAYRAVLDRLPDDAYARQELMKLEKGR
jgi:tetratricopeptide (TPR) repeat protein